MMTKFQKFIVIFRHSQKYQIAVFIALLFLGWFYWFQSRPSNIRTNCHSLAMDKANKYFERIVSIYDKLQIMEQEGKETEADKVYWKLSKADRKIYQRVKADRSLYYQDDYKDYYTNCLHEKGL